MTVYSGTSTPGLGNDPATVIAGMVAGDTWDGGGTENTYLTNGIVIPANVTIQNATIRQPSHLNTSVGTDGSTYLTFTDTSQIAQGMYVYGHGITGAALVTANPVAGYVNLLPVGSGTISGLLAGKPYTFVFNSITGQQFTPTANNPIQPHFQLTEIRSATTTLSNLVLNGANSNGQYHGNPWVNGAGMNIQSCSHVAINGVFTNNTYGDGLTVFFISGGGGDPAEGINCTDIQVNGLTINGTGREGLTLGAINGADGINYFNDVTVLACAQNAFSNESDVHKVGCGGCVFNNFAVYKGGMNLISYLNGDMTFNCSYMQGDIGSPFTDPYGNYTVTFQGNGTTTWLLPRNNSSNPSFDQKGGNLVIDGFVFQLQSGTANPPFVRTLGAASNPQVASANFPNSTIPGSSSSGQGIVLSALTGSMPISPNGNISNIDAGVSFSSTPSSVVYANGFNTFIWSSGVPSQMAAGLYLTGGGISEACTVTEVTTNTISVRALSGDDIGSLPVTAYTFQTAINFLSNTLLGTCSAITPSSPDSIVCTSSYVPNLGGNITGISGDGTHVTVTAPGTWVAGTTVVLAGLSYIFDDGNQVITTGGTGSFQYASKHTSWSVQGTAFQGLIILGCNGFNTGAGHNGNPNGGPWAVTAVSGGTFTLACGSANLPDGTYTANTAQITQQGSVSATLAYTSVSGTRPSNYAINGVSALFGTLTDYLYNGTGGANSDVGVLRQQYPWVPANFTMSNCDLTAVPLSTWGTIMDNNPSGYSSISIDGTV